MTAEDYVRPVTRAREARAAWREAWPFRVLTVIVLVALALGVYYLVAHLHIAGGGNSQG
ncbi:MAG TPA: hypothetical protein VGN54_14680 [Mycobacteriales bacterium]|jgi:hypothetical protein|nr:hypothetical protein [Mycobacteriales bacterium]